MSEYTQGYLPDIIALVILLLIGAALTNFGKARWWKTFIRHSDRWACLFVGMLAMGLLQQLLLGQSPPALPFTAAFLLAAIAIGCANGSERHAMIVAESQLNGSAESPAQNIAAPATQGMQDFPTLPTARKRRL